MPQKGTGGRTRSLGPCSHGSRERQDPDPSCTITRRYLSLSRASAVSCKSPTFVRCRFSCVSKPFFQTCRLVLRRFRVLAAPITRGRWSCSPPDGFQSFEANVQVLSIKVSIIIQHTVSAKINAKIACQRAWKAPKPSSRSSIFRPRKTTHRHVIRA